MSVQDTAAEAPAARGSLLPTALLVLAFLVVAVVFSKDATWYTIFLTVHIAFVVVWIGGGLLLTIFGLKAERSRDPAEMTQLTKMAAFAGERIFAPAAMIVLAAGIGMVLNVGYSFDQFWLIFGLIGFASTFIIGIGVLSPRARKLDVLLKEKGPADPQTLAAISQILLIARFDMAVLLLVIVDMVMKPFA
jgi:uncharacterized membrane protein